MTEIRYLVDENTARALGDQLRRRQPTINVIYVNTWRWVETYPVSSRYVLERR